jgi:hypothetical protein
MVIRFDHAFARRIGLERELSAETLAWKEVTDLINQAGLMKTVSGLGNCYAKLVKEFIVNIPEDCDNPLSNEYHKVWVRNKCVKFSLIIINRFLGRQEDGYSDFAVSNNVVCKTITANQVNMWPSKGKVPSCMLSVKYAVLNRIGTVNWVPTTHSSHIATGLARVIYSIGTDTEADYGKYIFDETMDHGKSWAVKMPIAFPTLICGIILDQHPDILTAADEPLKRESPLSLHFKLFEGAHAADITGHSRKVSAPRQAPSPNMDRKSMITSLEATIQALDEQKKGLEHVLSALKQEEAEAEGLETEGVGASNAADAADGDAAENEEAGGDPEELEVTESSNSF